MSCCFPRRLPLSISFIALFPTTALAATLTLDSSSSIIFCTLDANLTLCSRAEVGEAPGELLLQATKVLVNGSERDSKTS
jgi:hypothetical protein